MDSDAESLAARINTAIRVAIPSDPPRIRAFKRTHRTGELTIFFDKPEHAEAAIAAESMWVRRLNSDLKVRVKTYTIMVHGISTSFDPTDKTMIRNLQQENGEKLNSLELIRWANPIPIQLPLANPFPPYSSV